VSFFKEGRKGMMIKKYENFFCYDIFYFLLIFLLVAGASYQNIAIAQTANQQLSSNSTEPFSLVFSLDPAGKATVDDAFQQGNLLAIIYGKFNLKVFDLDSNQTVYEISDPDSLFGQLYLLENYLIYLKESGQNYETICVNLSTEEPEIIIFPGMVRQVTDDGHLIIFDHGIYQVIDLEVGLVLFELEVSKGGGEIFCVDDVIIFPFDDSRGHNAGYKAVSTNGEVKFTLDEIFNEVRIFLPEHHSKISTFPIPILICRNYHDQNNKEWFLEFINKEGQIIASYSPADLGIEYSYGFLGPSPILVWDENQDHFLLKIRYYKQGEPDRYYYILTDLSGNIVKIFDETEVCDGGFDLQGNILLFSLEGLSQGRLKYYQQNGNMAFSKSIPCLVTLGLHISGVHREFKFPGMDAILGWEYNQFEKYSLTTGELTGIYPISTDYEIYKDHTIIYDNQVYFFANSRGGSEPKINGSNYFSFSAADSGWLGIELVSIEPNAGTIYEVWDNTEVKVKFRTEYGSNFGKNLAVNFEKGELLAADMNNLEYTWHTPTIVSGNLDTAKITVSYGPVSQEFIITIKDHLPTASFIFTPLSPQTGQNVRFDASLSSDLDGEITTYKWDFGDGTGVQEQQQNYIDHLFSTAGEYPYLVTLTVTDNNGQTATISKNIRVTPAPEPPIANFKLLDPSPQWNTQVRFDASLSSDPDGSTVSYQWDFGDGTTGEGISVSNKYNPYAGGFLYEVTLTIKDNQNLSATKKIPIVVGLILSYENKGDIGIPAALQTQLVDYQIEVVTGDISDAGTDSFVYLALFGPEKENGRYGSGELSLHNAFDTFEKGDTDSFSIQGDNLEEVEFITLRHANNFDKSGWYVKSIKVKNTYNGKEWLFVPDQWLAMDEPPEYQTWGKFFPVEPHSILFKWKDRSIGMIKASDHIFILPQNVEYFHFYVLDKGFNLEVFQQEFLPNGTVSNTSITNQSSTSTRSIQYKAENITKPTRFLVKLKEGTSIRQEFYIWVFPAIWKDYINEARKVTLLYPLKGSTGIFLQGESTTSDPKNTLQDYLVNLKVNFDNASVPIIKYGADSLKIFGSVPDGTLLWYIKNPAEQYAKYKIAEVLASIIGETSTTITGEIIGLYDSLYQAAQWASRLDEVIQISTGEVYKIDLLKDIGRNNVNFLQSLELLKKLKEKVDVLIVNVENNNLANCLSGLESIRTLTVGNNPTSGIENDHTINYSNYGVTSFLKTRYQSCHSFYSQVKDYPLAVILADELYNIKSWRVSHHTYLDAYFGAGMSQEEINAALAEIDASPLLSIDVLQSNLGLSDEDKKNVTNAVMDVYKPIIMKLINISSILINASLLTDQSWVN
jgi:PKD repeat protein